MASVRYGWFTVRTECSHCGQPLPLNAPAQHVSCAHCLRDVRIPDELWRVVFEAYEKDHATLAVGERRPGTFSVEGLRVRYECAHGGLACEKCGSQFGMDSLAVGDDRDFSCRHCGDPASAYRPPGWLAALVPTVAQLYSIDPGGGAAADGIRFEPPKEAVRPVVMACPQCAGSLSVTVESERILSCQYCRSDIYLPDELWRRLHPVKTVTPFFVRFEGKTRFELAEEQRAQAVREAHLRLEREQAEAQQRRQRNQQAKERREQSREEQLDAAVASGKQVAWVAALVTATLMSCFAAWTWLSRSLLSLDPTSERALPATWGLGGAAVVFLLVATYFVSRPIQRRAGNPFEWILFVTWFWIPFALVMPVIGQIMALIRVVVLLRGRIGSATISSGQYSSRHYEAVRLPNGEGHPAAVLFLFLAVVWPLAILGLDPTYQPF